MIKKKLWIIGVIVLVLIVALVIGIKVGNKQNDDGAVSWQEQYDLGVRYLSEGNYEEAIIAFTAAIEIDSKQPDVYLKLVDAYVLSEDIEKALEILEYGLDNIGENPSLQSKYDELLSMGSIVISNVIYDEELVGDPNGTPTTFTVSYNCPTEEEYLLKVGPIKDGELICILDYSSLRVKGKGTIDVKTRLIFYETEGEGFEIWAGLMDLDPITEDGSTYGFVCETRYKIDNDFVGVQIPEVPQYDRTTWVNDENRGTEIQVTGTLLQVEDVFSDYLDCNIQYRLYADNSYSSCHLDGEYIIKFDDAIVLDDGSKIEYAMIRLLAEFWQASEENETFREDNLGKKVTVTGYLFQQTQAMGNVLEGNGTDFDYMFTIPYGFDVKSVP